MKIVLLLLFLIFSISVFGQKTQKRVRKYFELPKGISNKEYVSGIVILKFRRINATEKISINSEEIQSLKIKSAVINQVKQLFDYEMVTPDSARNDEFGLKRIVEIKYSSTAGIEQIINEILENSNVEYAEPQYIDHSNSSTLNHTQEMHAGPNDPMIDQQDYLKQIHAFEAWNILIGAVSPVIIAVVDSGVQLAHEDLASNIIDDYDFVGTDDLNPEEDDDANVDDPNNWHGTHVSGLAAAITNNAKGIASVVNNYARLMILKTSTDIPESNNINNGYKAIQYAADHGAKIINCSWGSTYGSQANAEVIQYALSKDCLIVAAAGNGGAPLHVDYPAAYPGVLAIASVSPLDKKQKDSNYGREVALSAPGENIYSTVPKNAYTTQTGTSMATPIVASSAALVKAKFPFWTMKQVGEQLKATTDNIDEKNRKYKDLLGTGRLNVYRALTAEPQKVSPSIKIKQVYPNPAQENTNLKFRISSDGKTSVLLYTLSGKLVKEIINERLQNGKHHLLIPLTDLQEGIYILKIHYENIERALKLVVQK